MSINFVASFVIAAAATAPASAPPQPQIQNDEIVVTGRKDDSKSIGDFVKALTPVVSGEQLGRFEHNVCPAVYGLARPQADAVAERVRLVARTVGIAVGKPGCAPNLVVIATSDKARLIAALDRNRPEYLADQSPRQVKALERQAGPTAAWQLKGPPVGTSGMELYQDPATGVYTNRTIDSPSRISEAVRPQFDSAVVVVERKALVGLTTTQLADYVAIRALTGADPQRLVNAESPTILRVFEVPMGGEAPITMTQWDFAFLKGFYDVRRNLGTGAQRKAIAKGMSKEIQQPHGH